MSWELATSIFPLTSPLSEEWLFELGVVVQATLVLLSHTGRQSLFSSVKFPEHLRQA